jgi:hypothetical protein
VAALYDYGDEPFGAQCIELKLGHPPRSMVFRVPFTPMVFLVPAT